MSHLAITLFGGFQVQIDGQPLTGFATDKNRALLAYLALQSNRPHRRETLAALLWPEQAHASAFNSLRQSLFKLRHLLPQISQSAPYLLITSDQVQFNPASDHWIDAIEFKKLLSACQLHHPQGLNICITCLDKLQRAVDLYQGEILAGLSLPRCHQFTDWETFTQQEYHLQALAALSILESHFEANLEYKQLIETTQLKIKLEPWHESAYRRQMWALAMSGQREQALKRYKDLHKILQLEMDTIPTHQTKRLYEQIRDGALPVQRASPGELLLSVALTDQSPVKGAAPFVGRQFEMEQLNGYLAHSLKGQGRIVFLSGEAGSGKTALMNEFTRQAVNAHDDLLVAGGICTACFGMGEHMQPFREVLRSLLDMNTVSYTTGTVSKEHTRRLKAAFPLILQTLLESSPGLVNTLIPAEPLLQQARKVSGLDHTILARLENQIAHHATGQGRSTNPDAEKVSPLFELTSLKQTHIFEQVTRLLQTLSQHFPLLIILDDLHWSESTTAGLLFHLGTHLAGGRILLLGAYRPEEIILTGDRPHHPMNLVINEFMRRFGEIEVDLSHTDGHLFINDFLDNIPNHLDKNFRESLYQFTGGNPLFTVELLRAMHTNGELVEDRDGSWVHRSEIDWERFPSRVEAVIIKRLERLDNECLNLLETASVQGEVFIVEVLAQVAGVTIEEISICLNGSLSKQHLLVKKHSPYRQDHIHLHYYQFRHAIIQKYLYKNLDEVKRGRLLQATTKALVKLLTNL